MTTVEVLRATRAKLAQGWTQCATARDTQGWPVVPLHPGAIRWCPYGAAIAAGASLDERLLSYEVLRRFTNGAAPDAFNDHPDQTHVSILCWLDRSIEAAESEAA